MGTVKLQRRATKERDGQKPQRREGNGRATKGGWVGKIIKVEKRTVKPQGKRALAEF